MARHDAEVAADVGNDGPDGATADLDRDLLGCGQAESRVKRGDKRLTRGGGVGGSRRPRSAAGVPTGRRGFGVQSGGVADDPGFERLGPQQTAGDAREDQGDVTGAELVRIVPERGDELPAVVD